MIESGCAVGYGCSYVAPRRRRISTIAVGYADGYLRSLGNRGAGMVDGIEVPLVGRVSMDTITFDTTDVSPERVVPGALIELLSQSHPVDTVAAWSGTIGYEILTSLGKRYCREYVGG
jgi:alanine racemase